MHLRMSSTNCWPFHSGFDKLLQVCCSKHITLISDQNDFKSNWKIARGPFLEWYFHMLNPWKLNFTVIQIVVKWLLWNFAYQCVIIASQLSWLEWNFLAIWYLATELHLKQISIDLNDNAKIIHEVRPRFISFHYPLMLTIVSRKYIIEIFILSKISSIIVGIQIHEICNKKWISIF